MSTMNIYTFIPQVHSASSYYRAQIMAETARDLGLPVKVLIDTNLDNITSEFRVKSFCESDLILLYQPIGDGTLQNVKVAKSFIPSLREGKWKYPPTFILDTDDNLFRVDPKNPAFANLGCRDPETGEEIPKGFSISDMTDGVRKVLYKDGAKTADGVVLFDVERNKAALDTYSQLINQADCVTTTTPRCAKPLYEYATPRRTHVTPNLVRFDHYPQVKIEKDTSRVNILWQGGQNHHGDWMPLKDRLKNITRKYPQVHWLMWGVDYAGINEVIPPHRMTFLPWCDYREYKLRRVMIGEDISLAPLADTAFNRCRSAIKWYEATVSYRPAVTLAQATGPYLDEIQDGQTGLLFSNPQEFEDRLSLLIEQADERKRMASNAKDWISENRDAMKEIPKLIRFYENLRGEVKFDTPHMPEPAWADFEKSCIEAQNAQEAQAKAA